MKTQIHISLTRAFSSSTDYSFTSQPFCCLFILNKKRQKDKPTTQLPLLHTEN